MPTSLPPRRPPGNEAHPPSNKEQQFLGLQGTMLVVTLGLLVALVAIPLFHPQGRQQRSLRVVIAPPVLKGSLLGISEDSLDLLTEALDDAIDRALASRLGVRPIRPAPNPAPKDTTPSDPVRPQDLARKWQADEVLAVEVHCQKKRCRGNLARLRSVDGKPKWQRKDFSLPTDDLRQLEQKIAKEMAVAYAQLPAIQGAGRLFVEAEDYQSFLRLRRRHRRGQLGDAAQQQLSMIHRSSPRFLEAYLLSAQLALAHGNSSQGSSEASGLRDGESSSGSAKHFLSQARRIAPLDQRVLELSIPLLLANHQLDEVRSILIELRNQWPYAAQLEVWQEQLEAAEDQIPDQSSPNG